MADDDLMFKVILVGNSGTGKSCLLSRYAFDKFDPDTIATIGVEFATKKISMNNKDITVQIWDTAGQERFKSVTRAYYRGIMGAILVYDITCSMSFWGTKKWLEEIHENIDEDVPILLVGNKVDLEAQRVVTIAKALEFAQEEKMMYIETSAKETINVNTAFEALVAEIMKRRAPQQFATTPVSNPGKGISVDNTDSSNESQGKSYCGC